MMDNIHELPGAAAGVVSVAETPDKDFSQVPTRGQGLLQRQLAADGLEAVAKKVAAGSVLDLADAVAMSCASLPLLGQIVQLCPAAGGNPGMDSDVNPGAETILPVQRVAAAADLPRPIAQPFSDWETFCRKLLDIRSDCTAASEAAAWYPDIAGSPDESAPANGSFTGVDVLRAVALARLLLPPTVQVVAPLAMLGPKLAQVALEFGATHLGYVAADGQVFDSPLVASRGALDELRGSCSPTDLREEM